MSNAPPTMEPGSSFENAIDLTGDYGQRQLPPPPAPPSLFLPGLMDRPKGEGEVRDSASLGQGQQPPPEPRHVMMTVRRSVRFAGLTPSKVHGARMSTVLPFRPVPDQVHTQKIKRKKTDQRAASPELLMITNHRKLRFWKDKYFQELDLKNELRCAKNAFRHFDKSILKTMVTDRYLRTGTASKKGHPVLRFPGTIEIRSAGQAVRQAYEEHTPVKSNTSRLVLWTDGSGGGNHRGFAVAWRRSTPRGWGCWEVIGFKALGHADVETLAVIKAIDKACELASNNDDLTTVSIYTDSTGALYRAQNPEKDFLGETITRKARKLRTLGTSISLHWCPGHSKVLYSEGLPAHLYANLGQQIPGNELADKVAGFARTHVDGNMTEVIDVKDDDEEDGWESEST